MAIFEYQAVNAEGKQVRGTIHGSTLDAAAKGLADSGLIVQRLGLSDTPMAAPTGIERASAPVAKDIIGERAVMQTSVLGPVIGKVPLPDLHFFFRQAATMLDAGVNPVQAFETLSRQSRNGKLSGIVKELSHHAQEGRPMSFGMQRYPEVFTPLIMGLLRAGEEGGFLVDSLRLISEYLEREIELRNMIRRQTAYPKLIVGASMFIVLGVNFFVPGALHSPLTEPAVLIVLIPVLIGLFVFLRIGLNNGRIKYNWDNFVLKIPWINGMVHGFAMAKFGRAFGALYRGGVSIPKSLVLAADACGNEAVRARIYPAQAALENGEGITDSFRRTNAFSPIVLDMTATGEMTGSLDQMLEKMSEFYEDEGKTRSEQLAWAIGVVAMLMVGAYIGYVVISFWTGFGQQRVQPQD